MTICGTSEVLWILSRCSVVFFVFFFITFKTFKIVFYICVWLKYKNVQDLTNICQQNSVCDQQIFKYCVTKKKSTCTANILNMCLLFPQPAFYSYLCVATPLCGIMMNLTKAYFKSQRLMLDSNRQLNNQ